MGSVKINLGGTWKEAKKSTSQSCSECKYNCTNACVSCTSACSTSGGCSSGCSGGCNSDCYNKCRGRCYGSCTGYCNGCTSCRGECLNSCKANTQKLYGVNTGQYDDYSSYATVTVASHGIGEQYGTGTGYQTTTTYTGMINRGGLQTDLHCESKYRRYLEDCDLTSRGGFHLWVA